MDTASTPPPFKSLFLPLKPEDCAVYASICSLLTLSLPRPKADLNVSVERPSASSLPSAPTTALYSPAEGEPMETGGQSLRLGTSDGPAMRKSALFAVLSGRADGAVVVLKNRSVVFFSLSHPTKGPVEVSRFSPVPTTKEAQSAPSFSSSAAAKSEATCASLIPMELTYLCRIDSKQQTRDNNVGPIYLRGLVGCKDGRVSVFSESSYVFSFAAHTCPVIAVHAIYSYKQDSDAGGVGSPSTSSPPANSRNTGFPLCTPVRSLAKAAEHLGYVTAGKDGTVYVWRQQEGNIAKPKPLSGATSVRRTVALCVYQPPASGWFLSALTADPHCAHHGDDHRTASVTSGGPNPMLATYQSLSSRAGGTFPVLETTAAAAEEVMPCPMALYSLPGGRRSIRSQLLSSRAMATEASQSLSETITNADVHDYVLPNRGFFRTTTIATDGDICVVSFRCKLQAFPLAYMRPLNAADDTEPHSLAARIKEPVFTADSFITHVALAGGLCVVACGAEGLVHVLQVPSFTKLLQFNTYDCRPVASLSLFPSARLIAVVDAYHGSVELVQVQENAITRARAALRQTVGGADLSREAYALLPAGAKALPTAVALRYNCEVEQLVADMAKNEQDASTGSDAVGCQDELRAYREAVLLSSMSVSPACESYLFRDTRVL